MTDETNDITLMAFSSATLYPRFSLTYGGNVWGEKTENFTGKLFGSGYRGYGGMSQTFKAYIPVLQVTVHELDQSDLNVFNHPYLIHGQNDLSEGEHRKDCSNIV